MHSILPLLGRPTLVRKALSFTHELSFLYQSTALSSRAVGGHQMYSGGSVVGKASTVGRDLAHLSPNFYRGGGGQKVRNLASFSTSLEFEPPAFENAARYRNSETNYLCRNDLTMPLPLTSSPNNSPGHFALDIPFPICITGS